MNLSPKLQAHALAADSRIAQAKKLLAEAVQAHQKSLTGIRQPDPELKKSYSDLIDKFNEFRGNKLWFPFLGSGIGNGALVELCDGSVKYDFISGIGVHYLGHSHADMLSAAVDAAICDTTMQGNLQQNLDSVGFSEMLIKASGLDHCMLSTSGAMANENALKIAFQKRHPANRILAFNNCFAGRSWALSQITDKPSFRDGLPLNVFVDYIPFFDPSKPKESIEQSVAVLKQHIARYPKQHALFFAELVQGESGFYPGSTPYFEALFQVAKENHISILADEVQTFGRTSALFAFQHFKLEKYVDLVTIGKLSQVCATLFRKDHCPRPGLLSQTFTGSTSAIHAGKAIINHLMHGGYFGQKGKIQQIHDRFERNFSEIERRHPQLIKGPYGIGAMIAFTPLGGDTKVVTQFTHALFEAGVIAFIAGQNPTRVRFLVPVGAVTDADIDAVTSIVEKVLTTETQKK